MTESSAGSYPSQDQLGRAAFDRPLLLTPGEDLSGYALGLSGKALLTLVACFAIFAVLGIFGFIIAHAWTFIGAEGFLALLHSDQWYPTHNPKEFGALGIIYGSFMVTILAVLIAGPVGILAAVFLSDIAPFKVRQVVKPLVELLAAIPSVAYGFFAILVVAPWLQNTMGLSTGANALNASLLLAVMAVPTIVSIAEDSLSAIGRELREGAYALGSTRAEVMLKVLIPAAHSGILAALILGIMRAIGETMLVWMAAGSATGIPSPWYDLTAPVRTLTATVAAEMGETQEGGVHRSALFAVALLLLIITFVLNIISEYFMARTKRIARGSK